MNLHNFYDLQSHTGQPAEAAITGAAHRTTSQAHTRPFTLAWLREHAYILIPVAVAVGTGILFASSTYGTQDDDGYIFYQYARNLAGGHGLSFNPGEVSYGTTSLLWVLLLAAVHRLLGMDIIIEAQAIGLALYAASAGLWAWAAARWTGYRLAGMLGAGVYALELDPMKYSLQGLETGLTLLLFAALACLMLDAGPGWMRAALPGVILGLSMLNRPDSIVAAMPVAVLLVWGGRSAKAVAGRLALFGLCTLAVAAPWYGWLWLATGSPVPPTQTGKLLVFLPQEFGITLTHFQRLGLVDHAGFALEALAKFASNGGAVRLALVGFGALMLVTALLWVLKDTRRRYALWPLLIVACLLLQVAIYIWLFPLLKLRYLINLLPAGLVIGTAGLALLWVKYRAGLASALHRVPVVPTAYRLANHRYVASLALLAILGGGLVVYGYMVAKQLDNYRYYVAVQDVRRQVGLWLRQNTPTDSLIALEPIGAIGFYSDRRVLDLGGLTDTTTWPALTDGYRNPSAIAALLESRGADYLVDYTQPEGIGGFSAALTQFEEGRARQVAVISSPQAQSGNRGQYGSYTIFAMGKK
jgi:hypothetical protein